MIVFEAIVKILILFMVSIVSLAVVVFIVLAGGSMLCEFTRDKIRDIRRKRK